MLVQLRRLTICFIQEEPLNVGIQDLSLEKMPEIRKRLQMGYSLRQIARDLHCGERLIQKVIAGDGTAHRCPECGRMMVFSGPMCRECKVQAEKEAQRKKR